MYPRTPRGDLTQGHSGFQPGLRIFLSQTYKTRSQEQYFPSFFPAVSASHWHNIHLLICMGRLASAERDEHWCVGWAVWGISLWTMSVRLKRRPPACQTTTSREFKSINVSLLEAPALSWSPALVCYLKVWKKRLPHALIIWYKISCHWYSYSSHTPLLFYVNKCGFMSTLNVVVDDVFAWSFGFL